MKQFFIGLASIFTSCIFPTKQALECEGIIVLYTGHPVEKIIKMSKQNLPRLSSPNTRVVALVSLPPNPWQVMNTQGIDVVREQRLGNIPTGRVCTGKDGIIAILTKKSSKHLCSKHGYQVGINDPLPLDPNAKPNKYTRIITKTNNPANELFFGDIVERVMQSPESQIYPDVIIRGVKGHGYYTPTNFGPDNPKYKGFFVGIHTEGQHAGRLLKAQPVSIAQLRKLQQFHIID